MRAPRDDTPPHRVIRTGETVAAASMSANRNIPNTLQALNSKPRIVGPDARYIAMGIIAMVAILDNWRSILLSEMSLDIEATIAFCSVSALEHTRDITSTMRTDATTRPDSSIR